MKEEDLIFAPIKSKLNKNRTGNIFGNNCEILGYAGNKMWYFKCGCGNISRAIGNHIDKGKNGCDSCGKIWKYNKSLNKMIGKTYNYLSVIDTYQKNTNLKNTRMFCHCLLCGNFCTIRADDILSDNTTSCGCLSHREKGIYDTVENKKFGRLSPIYHFSKNKSTWWSCKCDCGVIKDIPSYSLLVGHTKSCGCLRRDLLTGENNKWWNPDLTDEDREERKYNWLQSKLAYVTYRRDKNVCQKCRKLCEKNDREAHHCNSWANREYRYNLDLLCCKCHDIFHGIMIKRGPATTMEQTIEWLGRLPDHLVGRPLVAEQLKQIHYFDPISLGM